jgi:hypothetical protein
MLTLQHLPSFPIKPTHHLINLPLSLCLFYSPCNGLLRPLKLPQDLKLQGNPATKPAIQLMPRPVPIHPKNHRPKIAHPKKSHHKFGNVGTRLNPVPLPHRSKRRQQRKHLKKGPAWRAPTTLLPFPTPENK